MTIFWRVFLAFWLATAILLAIVFSANQLWPTFHRERPDSPPATSSVAVAEALRAYEQNGSGAFSNEMRKIPGVRRGVLLFGADGQLLSPSASDKREWQQIAIAVQRSHVSVIASVGPRVGTVFPVDSPSGQHYVIAITSVHPLESRFHRLRFWMKLAVAMVPATLICILLTLYITLPLSALQLTARRIAEGDLSARPPSRQRLRSDELGELTRDLDTMARRIEELVKAQRRFVADVSHELGAPLTRMQLALTLLRRELDDQPSFAVDQVEREADKLSDLVQELLFLASLDKGGVPVESFVPVSLSSLCEDIVRDNALELEERGCSVSTAFGEVRIQAAPQALRRAIENVLRNAIRHAPSGSTIQFGCEPGGASDLAKVYVSDSGPGVPPELLSSMFQPFVRAPAQAGSPAGTGLGLAIAAEAVALHCGTITASNRDAGGLSVVIQLPVHGCA